MKTGLPSTTRNINIRVYNSVGGQILSLLPEKFSNHAGPTHVDFKPSKKRIFLKQALGPNFYLFWAFIVVILSQGTVLEQVADNTWLCNG